MMFNMRCFWRNISRRRLGLLFIAIVAILGSLSPWRESVKVGGPAQVIYLAEYYRPGVQSEAELNEHLVKACIYNWPIVTNLSLNEGADVHHRLGGYAPIHLLMQPGHVKLIHVLISHGADVDALDSYGNSPLYEAVYYEHMDCVKVLLSYGAEVDVLNHGKMTALYAAILQSNEAMAILLISHGASVEPLNTGGIAPLQYSIELGNVRMCKLLIHHSADIEGLAPLAYLQGNNMLHTAVLLHRIEIVELLIQNGVKLETMDDDRRTALVIALENNDEKMAILLLNNGANPNSQTNTGMTALHLAAEHYMVDATALLINKGAKLDAENDKGQAALEYVRDMDVQDVKDLLIDAMKSKELQPSSIE